MNCTQQAANRNNAGAQLLSKALPLLRLAAAR